MIVPDTKDWTWVLERPCDECGFDSSSCDPRTVPALMRENARNWERLARTGRIAPGRPDDATWSSLEYACHVRDVYRRAAVRIGRMVDEDDPVFDNWDQDATAVDDAYEDQDPLAVVEDLADAAESVAALIDALPASAWLRPGRRSDGAAFRVETLVVYTVHDPIHHVWDVEKACA